MANKVQTPETDIMVETKGKLELFFDKYGNMLLKGLAAVTAIAVAAFIIVSILSNNKQKAEDTAQAALTVALTTEADAAAYAAIVAEYEGTKAANTAAYIAGAEYLKAGDIENAKAFLAQYTAGEGAAAQTLNALVETLRGDVAVEENDLQTAAELFGKAMVAGGDMYTYETAATKLALVYLAMGDYAKAQQLYKDIVAKYPELASKYSKLIAE